MDGKNLEKLNQESGGHRIQRVPPTEKRGRVHTSTVTVAVMSSDVKADAKYSQREEHDFYAEWFSGTGAGGMHRNKKMNSCRLYHLPTGLVESRQGRSRTNNLEDARKALEKLLDAHASGQIHDEQSADRKQQVGSGMRGDKRRTYRFQDNQVVDHINNTSCSTKLVMRGQFDLLWK